MKQVSYFIAALILLICLEACSSKQNSYSEFVHLPDVGWLVGYPCYFAPTVDDSLACYDVRLAIRYDKDYLYSGIGLVVDLLSGDSVVNRANVSMRLSDSNGNWLGSGFGSLYQMETLVHAGINLDSINHIVVWQSTGCDTLPGVTEVGITIEPSN